MGSIVKVVCLILAAIIVIAIVGSILYCAVKTVINMVNGSNFTDAISNAWNDLIGIFGAAKADGYIEYEYTVNKYVNVVACTSL